jgi:hypothetical protein
MLTVNFDRLNVITSSSMSSGSVIYEVRIDAKICFTRGPSGGNI